MTNQSLEAIANSLKVVPFNDSGAFTELATYMYVSTIQKFVSDTTENRIMASPIGFEGFSDEEWAEYELKMSEKIVGQLKIRIPGQMIVNRDDLLNGLRVALKSFPQEICVHINSGSYGRDPGWIRGVVRCDTLKETSYKH